MVFGGYDYYIGSSMAIANHNQLTMPNISALILEDFPASRNIINRGIRKFNSESSEWIVSVVSEISQSQEAKQLIENNIPPIDFIFLNYSLPGSDNGFMLSQKYPDLAYIVISSHPKINDLIGKEKDKCKYSYMENITESVVLSSEDVVIAIKKMISVLH